MMRRTCVLRQKVTMPAFRLGDPSCPNKQPSCCRNLFLKPRRLQFLSSYVLQVTDARMRILASWTEVTRSTRAQDLSQTSQAFRLHGSPAKSTRMQGHKNQSFFHLTHFKPVLSLNRRSCGANTYTKWPTFTAVVFNVQCLAIVRAFVSRVKARRRRC